MDNLGVADATLILDATEALVAKEPKGALLTVQALADSGRDYEQFMRDLAGHLRHLLVVQTLGEVPDSFAVTAEHTDRLAAQAERLSQAELLRAVDLLAAALAAVKEGSEPRLQLEVALLKATQPQADQSLQALMFRIDQLEATASAAAEAAPAPRRAEAPAPSRPPAPRACRPNGRPSARGAPAAAARRGRRRARGRRPRWRRARGGAGARPRARHRTCGPRWPTPCASRTRWWRALVSEAVPSALDGDRLTVSFPADAGFLKKKAEANRELVLGALRTLTGRALAVAFELSEAAADTAPRYPRARRSCSSGSSSDFAAEEVFEDETPRPRTERAQAAEHERR